MNIANLTQHPCQGKCTNPKKEYCQSCLINEMEQEPVALFVSDIEIHYQRALKSQKEVT